MKNSIMRGAEFEKFKKLLKNAEDKLTFNENDEIGIANNATYLGLLNLIYLKNEPINFKQMENDLGEILIRNSIFGKMKVSTFFQSVRKLDEQEEILNELNLKKAKK